MAHNETVFMGSSQEIFEKYHIDEELGFALPKPLVRWGYWDMGKNVLLSLLTWTSLLLLNKCGSVIFTKQLDKAVPKLEADFNKLFILNLKFSA